MKISEARDVVKYILAGFPAQRQRLTEEDVKGMFAFYTANLTDLELAPVLAAIDRLAKTARFIPTVAEIREAVGIVHHGEQTPGAIAWGEVHGFVRTKGSHRRPGVDFEFSDPIAALVVRSFGWEDICASTNQDSLRARFIDAYSQISRDERKVAALSAGGKHPELGAPRSRARLEREGERKTIKELVGLVTPELET